jgi:hypothetical protein
MIYRHLAIAIALCAPLCLSSVARAADDPYQATVTKVVNQVDWQRSLTTRWQKASTDTFLMPGDTLRTGESARAELLYGDGSVTRVGSLTRLTLTGGDKRTLHLDAGRIWLHIMKHSAGMQIITPGAVAAVTGTQLMVDFDPIKQLTQVTVFEGSVNVSSDIGNLVRVTGGTTTMVPLHAPAFAPVPLDNRKIQERDGIFKPLALPAGTSATPASGSGSSATTSTTGQGAEGKTSTAGSGETKQGTDTAAKNDDATDAQATTPETKTGVPSTDASVTGQSPTGAEVKTPPDTSAPTDPKTETTPSVKIEGANLKNQTERLLDPRLLNGSPTTGRVKVIIE